jgi:DNA sulfur modification protein DndC
MELLREACGGDRIRYELARELLDVERRHRSMARRAGLFEELEGALRKGYYANSDDAADFAEAKHEARQVVEELRQSRGANAEDFPMQLPLLGA